MEGVSISIFMMMFLWLLNNVEELEMAHSYQCRITLKHVLADAVSK